MKIVFRTDATTGIGTGHVMRCITLAEGLSARGAECVFVSRPLPEGIRKLLVTRGIRTVDITFGEAGWHWETDAGRTREILLGEGKPDWLIVDHYGLDGRWEERIRPCVGKIMVIDDLANRPHVCEVLLDQNCHTDSGGRYEGLVPPGCRMYLGPRHALLRHEFIAARRGLRDRDGRVRRILIFMGGSDPTNETGKAIEAMRLLNRTDIAVDVVIGDTNPHQEAVSRACASASGVHLFVQVETMASRIATADLSIGGGGTATWERCWLGLPSIIVILADNQADVANAVSASGAAWNLGWREDVEPGHIANAVRHALDHPEALRDMGKRALELVGGTDGTLDDSLYRALMGEPGAPA